MKKILLLSLGAALLSISFTGCQKDNNDPTPNPVTSATESLALKVTTAPTIDGSIDAAWSKCDILATTLTVPDPGGNTPLTGGTYFRGYVGKTYNFTMKSMYDAENIYFLFEWNDPKKDLNRDPWYFDTAAKLWKQEGRFISFDASGNKTRDAFYEDKFAMLWNVNESMASFNTLGCFASCHTGLDLATHFNAPALHYTNSATEKLDMWHWKSVRTGLYKDGTGAGMLEGQMDDQYQDNAEFGVSGGTAEGGRKSDAKTSGGYGDNKQTLNITGTTTPVSVPKYLIPAKTNYYAILQSEIDNKTAKLITAVDANGVLTYDGGTLDPNTDVQFQRSGATTGTKCIPSVYISAIVGDRGDIATAAVHTGSGWVMEVKRKLQTGSATDVQFDATKSFVFGVGIFDNAALAHAIQPKLTLKFAK
jgi:hypothetical protein